MQIMTGAEKTTSKSKKILILALGNPGEEFENTYHNAGVLALPYFVEALTGKDADELDWKPYKNLFEYAEASCQLSAVSCQLIFVHLLTFMNESGLAAAAAIKKFGVAPEDLVVAHDDSDIPLGEYKISFDRSSGGHKGAQSIIDHLKTQAFTRVRIGVRPHSAEVGSRGKPVKRQKAGDFVLAKISKTAMTTLRDVFTNAPDELKKKLEVGS